MSRRGSGLAGRFRRAVQNRDEARREREQAQARAAEQAKLAVADLFRDLTDFARETGMVSAASHAKGLTLSWEGRSLVFLVEPDAAALRIEFKEQGEQRYRLYQEASLGGRWVLVVRRGRREDRVPWFDQGLEMLLIKALGLPDPADEPEPPRRPPGKDL